MTAMVACNLITLYYKPIWMMSDCFRVFLTV